MPDEKQDHQALSHGDSSLMGVEYCPSSAGASQMTGMTNDSSMDEYNRTFLDRVAAGCRAEDEMSRNGSRLVNPHLFEKRYSEAEKELTDTTHESSLDEESDMDREELEVRALEERMNKRTVNSGNGYNSGDKKIPAFYEELVKLCDMMMTMVTTKIRECNEDAGKNVVPEDPPGERTKF